MSDTITMDSVRDAVRTFNKYVLNPAMLHLAGRKHWYASVIRHTGRISGNSYRTPVVADPVAGGFILPLPYGVGVDWVRNVLAADRAVITSAGSTYDVVAPEIIDAASAAALLSPRRRRGFRRLGIDKFLRVTLAK
ncbi:nitroreductase [Mycobacterium sp. WY10]|nr:nitroreductase [Mycobacterium sp. WY10]